MTDLLTRLRKMAESSRAMGMTWDAQTYEEAANEIERLRQVSDHVQRIAREGGYEADAGVTEALRQAYAAGRADAEGLRTALEAMLGPFRDYVCAAGPPDERDIAILAQAKAALRIAQPLPAKATQQEA